MNLLFSILAVLLCLCAILPSFITSTRSTTTSWATQYKVCTDAENIISTDFGSTFLCYSSTTSQSGIIFAEKYNTSNGARLWRQEKIPVIVGQVHVFQQAGVIFFQSNGIDLATGKVLWSNPSAGHECFSSYYPQDVSMDVVKIQNSSSSSSSLTVRNILILSCTVDMVYPIWALDMNTGGLLWKTSIPRWTFSGIGNIVNHILPVSVTNKVHGFDTLTGKVMWVNDKLPPSNSKYGNTFIALIRQNFEDHPQNTIEQISILADLADVVLGRYGVPSSNLFALNRSTGELLWNSSTFVVDGEPSPWYVAANSLVQTLEVSPIVDGKYTPTPAILIMTTKGALQLRHAKSGTLLAQAVDEIFPSSVTNTSSSIFGNPTSFSIVLVAPTMVYVKPLNNRQIFIFETGGMSSQNGWPPIGFLTLDASPHQFLGTGYFVTESFATSFYDTKNYFMNVTLWNGATANEAGNFILPTGKPSSPFAAAPKISGGLIMKGGIAGAFVQGTGFTGYTRSE